MTPKELQYLREQSESLAEELGDIIAPSFLHLDAQQSRIKALEQGIQAVVDAKIAYTKIVASRRNAAWAHALIELEQKIDALAALLDPTHDI